MIPSFLLLALLGLLQPSIRTSISMRLDALSLTKCVAVAPMPIADVSSHDPMPLAKPDTAQVERMPVGMPGPCYLANSGPGPTVLHVP